MWTLSGEPKVVIINYLSFNIPLAEEGRQSAVNVLSRSHSAPCLTMYSRNWPATVPETPILVALLWLRNFSGVRAEEDNIWSLTWGVSRSWSTGRARCAWEAGAEDEGGLHNLEKPEEAAWEGGEKDTWGALGSAWAWVLLRRAGWDGQGSTLLLLPFAGPSLTQSSLNQRSNALKWPWSFPCAQEL